jgi:hypothetical protein
LAESFPFMSSVMTTVRSFGFVISVDIIMIDLCCNVYFLLPEHDCRWHKLW